MGVRTWLPASVCVCVRARAPVGALRMSPLGRWGACEGDGAAEELTHYLGTGSCLLWLTSQHLTWVPFLHQPRCVLGP